MNLAQALTATEIQNFFFDWYPIFGVVFMFGLLIIFVTLLRGTMGTTKPETVKASKTEPVLWEEVQGVDAAKDELMDVAAWLRDPDRFAALGAQPPRGVLLFGPPGTVIVIAASNYVDKLDKALLRPGRFDRQVLVSPPDRDGREAILRTHARGKPLGADLDLTDVARKTTGMTGAQLANALNEAAIIAGRAGREAMIAASLSALASWAPV